VILRFNSSPYTNTVTATLLFAASICQENYWGNVLMRETEIVTVLDFVVYVYVYIYRPRGMCVFLFSLLRMQGIRVSHIQWLSSLSSCCLHDLGQIELWLKVFGFREHASFIFGRSSPCSSRWNVP